MPHKYIYSTTAPSDQTSQVARIPYIQDYINIQSKTSANKAKSLGDKKAEKVFKKASKNTRKPTIIPRQEEEYRASQRVNPDKALYNHVAYNLNEQGYSYIPNIGWVNPNNNGQITQAPEKGFFGKIKDNIYDPIFNNSKRIHYE